MLGFPPADSLCFHLFFRQIRERAQGPHLEGLRGPHGQPGPEGQAVRCQGESPEWPLSPIWRSSVAAFSFRDELASFRSTLTTVSQVTENSTRTFLIGKKSKCLREGRVDERSAANWERSPVKLGAQTGGVCRSGSGERPPRSRERRSRYYFWRLLARAGGKEVSLMQSKSSCQKVLAQTRLDGHPSHPVWASDSLTRLASCSLGVSASNSVPSVDVQGGSDQPPLPSPSHHPNWKRCIFPPE